MGGATAVCSDKTGTLTTNVMTVVRAWIAGTVVDHPGKQHAPESVAPLLARASPRPAPPRPVLPHPAPPRPAPPGRSAVSTSDVPIGVPPAQSRCAAECRAGERTALPTARTGYVQIDSGSVCCLLSRRRLLPPCRRKPAF